MPWRGVRRPFVCLCVRLSLCKLFAQIASSQTNGWIATKLAHGMSYSVIDGLVNNWNIVNDGLTLRPSVKPVNCLANIISKKVASIKNGFREHVKLIIAYMAGSRC